MIYLIHYERSSGKLVSIREFSDQQRHLAAETRLELEIELIGAGGVNEVVLLEADSRDDLYHSHGRYFRSLEDMKVVRSGK